MIKRSFVHVGSTEKFGRDGAYINLVNPALKHPNYNVKTDDYDFALVKTVKNFTWSDSIDYLDLPSDDDKIKDGDLCWAIGWGNKSLL